MKRILASLIICLMLLNGFVVKALTTSGSQIPKGFEEAESILSALGVPLGYTGENAGESVTRLEFVSLVLAAVGSDVELASEDVFSDISSADAAYNKIYTAYKMGLISGGGKFLPDDPITYPQALKMLVRLLGYDYYARQKGGYPTGYLITAQDIGLLKGIGPSDEVQINKAIAACLIYNALNVDIMEQTSFGSDPALSVQKGNNLMKTKLNVVSNRGIITASGITMLTSPLSSLKKNEVEINGIVFDAGKTKAAQYLGYKVKYYYKEEKDKYIKELVHVVPEDENDVLVVDGDDVESFVDGVLKYRTESMDEAEQVIIGNSADLIYNGKALTDYNSSHLTEVYGEIKLIDNNNDGTYDVVNVLDYQNYIVHSVNEKDSIVIGKYDAGELVLDPDKSDRIIALEKNNQPARVSDLKEWDVLSVIKSINTEGQLYFKAVVVNDSFEGSISEIKDDSVIINGTDFKLKYSGNDSIQIGDYQIFYLDLKGRICAFVKKDPLGIKYAYLINCDASKGLKAQAKFKLFNEEKKLLTLLGAEKIKVDGDMIDTSIDVISAIKSGKSDLQQLIRYKLNKNGEINYIDTTTMGKNETKDNLTKSAPVSGLKFKSSSSVFGGKCGIKPNTIIFALPDDLTYEKGYSIKQLSLFISDVAYSFIPYDSDEINIPKVIVMSSGGLSEIGNNTPMAIVDKVTKAIDPEGEIKYKLNVLQSGQNSALFVENNTTIEGKNIQQGDIIRYSVNSNNQITNIQKAFNADGSYRNGCEISIDQPAFGTVDTDYRIAYGTVELKKGTYMTVRMGTNTELFELSRAKIYIFDKRIGKVEIATMSDIYDSAGTPSTVVLRTRYGDMKEIFIIK